MDFVKAEYDKNDFFGKVMLTAHLMRKGYKVVVPKENYGVDIIASKDNQTVRWEVEVRSIKWTCQEDFPFDTVSFLGRKAKHGDFYYCLISEETANMVACHSSNIYKDEYIKAKDINKGQRDGVDIVYHVPKNLCEWRTQDAKK